jgi:hypothetical protein
MQVRLEREESNSPPRVQGRNKQNYHLSTERSFTGFLRDRFYVPTCSEDSLIVRNAIRMYMLVPLCVSCLCCVLLYSLDDMTSAKSNVPRDWCASALAHVHPLEATYLHGQMKQAAQTTKNKIHLNVFPEPLDTRTLPFAWIYHTFRPVKFIMELHTHFLPCKH